MTGGLVHAAGELQLQLVQGEHLLHEAHGAEVVFGWRLFTLFSSV